MEFAIIGVVLPLMINGLQDIWFFVLIFFVLLGISYAETLYRTMDPHRTEGGLVNVLSLWTPAIGIALALHRVYKWVKKLTPGQRGERGN